MHIIAELAQLGERLISNQKVVGSIPAFGPIEGAVSLKAKVLGLKEAKAQSWQGGKGESE